MEQPISLCSKVAEISTEFEQNNSELKRLYYIYNIMLFNSVVSQVDSYKGSFGTGYPFYALGKNLEGTLPIIFEQIRYNNELIDAVDQSKRKYWNCASCLEHKGHEMPDLKRICKPCPNMDDALKPRKIINRLPDLDMWMICDKQQIIDTSIELTTLFLENHMHTSDKNPFQTIMEIGEINNELKLGIMPAKLLPIDAHIIDYETLYKLIEQLPQVLQHALETGNVPYLPIHPLSYRKTWQYDDTAYNFVHDFLSSFTEYNLDETLQHLLNYTRSEIANNYSFEELYNYLISSGPESVLKRHRTLELKNRFKERVESWKK